MTLSHRQAQIAKALATGDVEIKEIAAALGLTYGVVSHHLELVRKKLGVKTNYAVVAWWWKHRLTDKKSSEETT